MFITLRPHFVRALVLSVPVVVAAQVGHGALTARHVAVETVLAFPMALICLALGARAGGYRFPVTAVAMTAMMLVASPLHALVMVEQTSVHHEAVSSHAFWDTMSLLPFIVAAAIIAWMRPSIRRQRRALSLGLSLVTVVSTFGGAQFAGAAVPAFSSPLKIPSVLTGQDIAINMQETEVQVLPGQKTKMWTYNGEFPGPTIRQQAGVETRVSFTNNLPTSVGSTTVHNHGNHSAPIHDGPPHSELIPTGGSRTYVYEGVEDGEPERAATQWYHDHRMDVTGRNVYMGLAGMYIIDDAFEATLPLPKGAQDVPLVIADREFDGNNQLNYQFDPNGVLGKTILVNGVSQPYFEVADRKYRFRVLNASNLRSYDLRMPNGVTFTQVGSESGLLPAPITRTHMRVGPGERAEIVIDFAGRLGQSIEMINSLGNGTTRQVMQFRVARDEVEDSSIPATLRPLPHFDPGLISMTRTWVLSANPEPLTWTINGASYDPTRIDTAPLNPKLDSTERWVFVNASTAEHVVHIHDVDWRLISRVSSAPFDAETNASEVALKEMFYIRPNEVITVAAKFTDHVGDYVFHCHLLEHEDRSMMANFRVEA